MVSTPICDFLEEYSKSEVSRLHMPGHKGEGIIGYEKYDITEVKGADCLFTASGIIDESEQNASDIFGTRKTFYSAGGSSQSIKAMLYLAMLKSANNSKTVVSARSSHQAFYSACALLDLKPSFIKQETYDILSAEKISAKNLEITLNALEQKPMAVFITSPDYLGTQQDIKALSSVCKKHAVPLLVDNAHGAYLRFIGEHPINLGADMCADSAHKTLPALTGAGYLHIAKNALADYEKHARRAMLLFGSTSPSYLILHSLDYCNKILSDNYEQKLKKCIDKINSLKQNLQNLGFDILKTESLKIVFNANKIGYKGTEIAEILRQNKIEAEYADENFLVLMLTSATPEIDFEKIYSVCKNIKIKAPIPKPQGDINLKTSFALSPREALFSKTKIVKTQNAENCICASVCVSCPPAVPIAISGEIINSEIITALKAYKIDEIEVVDND